MLTSEISLWPSGPMVTLGAYFIGFKYVFSFLLLLLAAGLLRRPSRLWLLGGTVVLAAFAARVTGVAPVRMTATLRWIKSATSAGSRL
jgi:hypothetical protein